jgi:hypothetical protein
MEGLFSTIVIDEVLEHVTRELVDTSVDGMCLVDDLASENVFEFSVHTILLASR